MPFTMTVWRGLVIKCCKRWSERLRPSDEALRRLRPLTAIVRLLVALGARVAGRVVAQVAALEGVAQGAALLMAAAATLFQMRTTRPKTASKGPMTRLTLN